MPHVDPHEALLEFHKAFAHYIGAAPAVPPVDVQMLRYNLIEEEWSELSNAMVQKDLVKIADAIADLLYVVYGTGIAYGIDIREIFTEVHRTNMLKVGGQKNAAGKTLKPLGWKPPRIAELLEGMTVHASSAKPAHPSAHPDGGR